MDHGTLFGLIFLVVIVMAWRRLAWRMNGGDPRVGPGRGRPPRFARRYEDVISNPDIYRQPDRRR